MVSGTTGSSMVVGEHECAALEYAHVSGERARSLGEYNERHAALQRLSCTVVCGAYLACAALVYEDVVSSLARLAYERHLA